MTTASGDSTVVSALELVAPAKVNLYLHVVGKRSDGYHLLDSLVAFAGFGDSLRFAAGDALTLTIDGPTAGELPAEPDNIVLAAARRLAEAAGLAPRAAIRLTKRLPVAAGIGGGSADGAAALRGLCALWRISLDEDELARIGLSLGADLPVCLRGRPTQMGGVGELLASAPPLPPAWLVLVNPGVGLSTPAVFKARQGGFSAPAPLTEPPADAEALAKALACRRNDLTESAIGLAPVVGEMLVAIEAQADCLLARMSGSGATCFGLFASAAAARSAGSVLGAAHRTWWVVAAPLVGRP
jgi:4-diphosphocytidyl-2-C-methyl-D-erythritol kinase